MNRIARSFVLLVIALVVALAAFFLVKPELFYEFYAVVFLTSGGLYTAAFFRVVFGLALLGLARASRAPRTIRVLGAFIIVAGISLPFIGVDTLRVLIDWFAAQGITAIRIWMMGAMMFMLSILYALTPQRAVVSMKTERSLKQP